MRCTPPLAPQLAVVESDGESSDKSESPRSTSCLSDASTAMDESGDMDMDMDVRSSKTVANLPRRSCLRSTKHIKSDRTWTKSVTFNTFVEVSFIPACSRSFP